MNKIEIDLRTISKLQYLIIIDTRRCKPISFTVEELALPV